MSRRYRLLIVLAIVSWSVSGLFPSASTAGAGGFCADAGFSDERSLDVGMNNMCFIPTVTRIDPGDTVTFHNKDKTLHMVGGVTNVFGDLHTEVPYSTSVSYRFKEEGVYPYLCVLHPGMGGAIVVGDGEGKASSDAAVLVPSTDEAAPPSDQTEAAAADPAAEKGDPAWIVPVAIALGVAVLGIAAIPMRRRSGAGVITTRL